MRNPSKASLMLRKKKRQKRRTNGIRNQSQQRRPTRNRSVTQSKSAGKPGAAFSPARAVGGRQHCLLRLQARRVRGNPSPGLVPVAVDAKALVGLAVRLWHGLQANPSVDLWAESPLRADLQHGGTLQRTEESFATRDFALKVRLLDYYKYYLPKEDNPAFQLAAAESASAPRASVKRSVFWTFWTALWLSTGLLFKVGFRDTTVSGRVLGIDLRYVVLFEWFFGFAVVAGLTITLANTQPLINSLVKGVF